MRKQLSGLVAGVALCVFVAFGARAAENEGHVAKSDKDKEIVAKQGPAYPLKTCVVTAEPLDEGTIDYIYKDRLVKLCCKNCIKKFEAEPAKYLAMIDKAAKDAPPVKASSSTGTLKEAAGALGGAGCCGGAGCGAGCGDGGCQ